MSGFIGSKLGYSMLKRLSPGGSRTGCSQEDPYAGGDKLEVLFGPGFWEDLKGKRVVDFGCGTGAESVAMAAKGAREVIGIDIRERALAVARERAKQAGVEDRCRFTREWAGTADRVVSVDAFEHFQDPARSLDAMARMLESGGSVWAVFGPTWYHPHGGHLFSVFPWSHLVFTEQALIRWRSDFKADGARRFSEVEGGLNQMTIARFERLVRESLLRIDRLDLIPIQKLRWLAGPWTREFTTSIVRCRLLLP